MYSYATPSIIRAQIEMDPTNPITDSLVLAKIPQYARAASMKVEGRCHQKFVPYFFTDEFAPWETGRLDRIYNLIIVNQPLLRVDEVAVDDDVVPDDEYRPYPGRQTPFYQIQRLQNAGPWFASSMDNIVSIQGLWGYREGYDEQGWIDSDDSIQNSGGIDETDRIIEILDASGENALSQSPRFEVGNVLKIDVEFVIILVINTEGDELTVLRGALGSIAAEHEAGTPLYVFDPEPEIVRATALIAAYNLNNIGNFVRVTINDRQLSENLEMPDEAIDILGRYEMSQSYSP